MFLRSEDIRKESILKKAWDFSNNTTHNYPEEILVTGANSFIGCHVVRQLMAVHKGKIHLLLRAPSVNDAILKMQQAYCKWGLGDLDPDRFIFHTGDVCANMMGLPKKEFEMLKHETGQVIHLAMTPLYHLPYHHFQRIWVPELERMIAFCGDKSHPKFMHYASSYNANFFIEDSDFLALNSNAWQSGYAGFKWVANQALLHAIEQNLGACIYDIPLVLGSEKSGICPIHYSIWLILDIFLKTGCFFPFTFRIIPVDILAEIIVDNVMKANDRSPSHFIRPLLPEPVTDGMFAHTAANLLGLKESSLESVRESFSNKLRFDFMVPPNFYELIGKVNRLPGVFPEGFDTDSFPLAAMVFMSNLNKVMSGKTEEIKI